MNYFFTTSILVFFISASADACIWEKSDPAYWPSNTIPVCFANSDNSPEIQNLKRIIRNAYTQLNQKTDFTFNGFTSCSQISSTRAAIRIKLDNVSVGKAHSIGPSSAYSAVNMDLPMYSSDGTNHNLPINEAFLAGTTIHETLHLLGFHHDGEPESSTVRKSFRDNPNLMMNGGYDPLSIMVNATENALSNNDIRCVNLVAQKSFVHNVEIHPPEQGSTNHHPTKAPKPPIEVIHITPAVTK